MQNGGGGIRADESRPKLGQRKTNRALMSETSADKPQPEAIPLNIYKHRNFSFLCPESLKAHHPEGASVRRLPSAKVCFLGGCLRSGRNQNLHRRDSEAEDRRAAGRSLSVARGAGEGWEKEGRTDREFHKASIGRRGKDSRQPQNVRAVSGPAIGKQ